VEVRCRSIAIMCLCSLCLGAGAASWFWNWRFTGERTELDRQRTELAGQFAEKQRQLESSINECLGYVDTARAISERNDAELQSAVTDLRKAKSYIEQAIKERQDLNDQLSMLRASLSRTGRLYRMEDN